MSNSMADDCMDFLRAVLQGYDTAKADTERRQKAAAAESSPPKATGWPLPSGAVRFIQLVAEWLRDLEYVSREQSDRVTLLARIVTPKVVVWIRELGGLSSAVGSAVSAIRDDEVLYVSDVVRRRLSSWTAKDTHGLARSIAQAASHLHPEVASLFTERDDGG